MVYTLLEPAGGVYALPGDVSDSAEWRRVFLRTGGMRHLLSLLGGDGGIDPSLVRVRASRAVSVWHPRRVSPGSRESRAF